MKNKRILFFPLLLFSFVGAEASIGDVTFESEELPIGYNNFDVEVQRRFEIQINEAHKNKLPFLLVRIIGDDRKTYFVDGLYTLTRPCCSGDTVWNSCTGETYCLAGRVTHYICPVGEKKEFIPVAVGALHKAYKSFRHVAQARRPEGTYKAKAQLGRLYVDGGLGLRSLEDMA